MIPRICITGWGLATALGATAPATWEALLAGRFIADHAAVAASESTGKGEARAATTAAMVARQAIAHAAWDADILADDGTALVVGTSKGPVLDWLAGHLEPPGLGQVAQSLATHLKMGCGPRLTLSAACASGLHALIRAAMLVQAGECRRVLCVACEASLHPLFEGSFRRLGVLPKSGKGCRPFDQHRNGFLMSEAAAAVCLQADAPGIAIDAYAIGGDATHLTGGDPLGRALRRLLAEVIAGRPVDLVHAHGTGTDSNDPAELAAIDDALAGQEHPAVLYSHKGALGHSLGAAGLVSVVINCMCHRQGLIPGNVRTDSPLPARRVKISIAPERRPVHRSIVLASGFGGAMAAVGLKST